MPAERLPMRKIREILRLRWGCGLSARQIARSLKIARSTVAEYVRRATAAALSWPLPEGLDETAIEQLLFPALSLIPASQRPLPDWVEVHQELRRKGVTLFLLWQEYKARWPEGFQYSRFCALYRLWAKKLDLSMRQEHRAGEKMFVDYCGQTVPVVDRESGKRREAQIFVAVLGASNYTYAEATWTQTMPDWVASHVRAFEYFHGVTELVIQDNLRSGVAKACRYEPQLAATYEDMLAHYGTVGLPTRVRHPKDKAKIEVGVQVTERWVLARLRRQSFFSLAELNSAIRKLLEELNQRPFRKLPGSRLSLFESLDRPALRPLPAERYVYAEWKKARVSIDYHLEVQGHYYSVPYQLYGQELDVRLTATTVEFFHKGQRVSSHARSFLRGRHTTLKEHMPTPHQSYAEWTPERVVGWTTQAGPFTRSVAEHIMASRLHPQQAFRSCLGLMRLGKIYGASRLEAACQRALRYQATSYRSVNSILKSGLDKQPLRDEVKSAAAVDHSNIRGSAYYEGEPAC
ncbi:MAG: IS21 family transposase [Candidatus Bathyarchaeota archaeon]|nr:IS21 family transposase [Candidatus Bathyarchaeota archaeon]